MYTVPPQPKIYHITHIDNLPLIIERGGLIADAVIVAQGGPATAIGMASIKQRRLGLPVSCHPGDCVGDYVPFYFCPRSIMLFLIHKGNHPELTYRGGQGPIVHLESDMNEAVAWAEQNGLHWAFSLSNAGAYYAQFRNRIKELPQVDWGAVAASDFRPPEVKEGKQAEFLVQSRFPWELVTRVGICSTNVAHKAYAALDRSAHRPTIEVRADWYF
jgi:hypothetical protein